MNERYTHVVIGHSDHTPDLYTCFAAVSMGAKITRSTLSSIRDSQVQISQSPLTFVISLNLLMVSVKLRQGWVVTSVSMNAKNLFVLGPSEAWSLLVL